MDLLVYKSQTLKNAYLPSYTCFCKMLNKATVVRWSWVEMISNSFSMFFFLHTHRQQVPERNQKKKKKMKWRAERSAGSHRFHCAILWPPSCLSFVTYSHPHAHPLTFGCQGTPQQWLTTGAQKGGGRGGGSMNGWMDLEGRKEKSIWNVELMSPQPFTMPWNERYALSSQFMVPFEGL